MVSLPAFWNPMTRDSETLRHVHPNQDGAAMTEKLVVVVLGLVLLLPAIGFLGPVLSAKFGEATVALGGTAVETLADRKAAVESAPIGIYVFLFIAFFGGFSTVFVAPLLFPRARISRQAIINWLAERFPFLAPLADWHSEGMEELYRLNAELEAMRPKDGALQVKSRDLSDSGNPNEVTVARPALKAPLATSYLLEDDQGVLDPLATLPIVGSPDDSATANWADAPAVRAQYPSQETPFGRGQHPSGHHDPHGSGRVQHPSANNPLDELAAEPELSVKRPADTPDMSLLTSIPIAEIDPRGERNQSPNLREFEPVHPVYDARHTAPSGHYPAAPDDSDATMAREPLAFDALPSMLQLSADDDDETTVDLDGQSIRDKLRRRDE